MGNFGEKCASSWGVRIQPVSPLRVRLPIARARNGPGAMGPEAYISPEPKSALRNANGEPSEPVGVENDRYGRVRTGDITARTRPLFGIRRG